MSDTDKCPHCGEPMLNGHHVVYIGPAGAKEYRGPIDGTYCLTRQLAAALRPAPEARPTQAGGKAGD